MPSRVLYDTRDNSILRSQAEPTGSAGLPSIKALYRSARVSESEKEYMDTVIVNGKYLTRQAQEQLRIVNDEVYKKPKLNINLSSNQITAGSTITMNLEITETIDSDNFQSVDMKINDVEFAVNIGNNQGSKEIQLDEPDEYIIRCNDHRFRSQSAKVEVI